MLFTPATDYVSLLTEQHHLKSIKIKGPAEEKHITQNENKLLNFERQLSSKEIIASTRKAFAHIPANR